MRDKIDYILQNYKSTMPKENTVIRANVDKAIKTDLVQEIKKIVKLNKDCHSYASCGKGNRSAVPWVFISDPLITTSAQEGYYLVYLFCADMSRVYLSLNQGWTYYENTYEKSQVAHQKAQAISEMIRRRLNFEFEKSILTKIDLKNDNKRLAKGYQSCHILGYYYDTNNLPDEAVLRRDLEEMCSAYEELIKMINRAGDWVKLNNSLLVEYEIDPSVIEPEENELDAALDSSHILLEESSKPMSVVKTQRANSKPKGGNRNPDYVRQMKAQKKIGLLGEKVVLEYEKQRLIDLGREDLAKKVCHVSVEKGDGEGYDILSYDETGKERWIEVKTTKAGKEEPFFLSANELLCALNNREKYFIYRLYDLDYKVANKAKFYIVGEELSEEYDLNPVSFSVYKNTPKKWVGQYIETMLARTK